MSAARLLVPVLAALALWGTPVSAEEPQEGGSGEVVVEDEGTGERTDPQGTSASVTVIEVDASLPASSDVSTVVDSASGTTVQRLGGLGDWAGVSIRGSTLRQVQVSLDGVPLNPDGSSAVNLSELPLWAFERVEIYRSNPPPDLASAPAGGAVDLRTGEGARGTGVSASVGSLRTGRLTAMSRVPLRLAQQPLDALMVAELFGTRGNYDYFSDNGTEYTLSDDAVLTRDNNDKRQLNAHGRLRLGPKARRVSLLQSFLAREEGLAGHANNPASSVRLVTRRSLSSLELDLGEGRWRGRVRGWGLVRDEVYDDRQGELGVGTEHTSDRFGSIGLMTDQKLALGDHLAALTMTVRQDEYRSEDLLAGAQSDAARRLALTPSLWGDLQFLGERLTLSPVLQVQVIDNHALGTVPFGVGEVAPDTEDTLFAFTPRGGALVRPWPWLALKGTVARTLRPPDFTELFGDRGAISGNTGLRPEEGVQWDLGARLVAPEAWAAQGSLELGYFQSRMDGLIVLVQNAQRTSVPVNMEDTWVQGVEAALSLRWTWVESQSNLTWNDSVNLSEIPQYAGKQLPRLPTWEAFQRTAFVWEEQLRVGHSWSYTDGNYWDRTNWYRATPRSLHGLFARVQPKERWPAVELDVLNLMNRISEEVPRNPLDPADEAVVEQPITDFVGYPLPGRTFLLTLSWRSPGA